MARQKSEDKRAAIMAAATRVIVRQGLSAPTLAIAKEAGIASGSLFTYFPTKVELFNQLFLELKLGMATATLQSLPARSPLREVFAALWTNWMRWAIAEPEQRRAIALLAVSDDITPATRDRAHQTMGHLAALVEQARRNGPLRDAPFALVIGLLNAVADTTMDFMLKDPTTAEASSAAGFEAVWRLLRG